MGLSNLVHDRPNIILLQTSSDKLDMLVCDMIRKIYRCNRDESFKLESVNKLPELRTMVSTYPLYSDKWYVEIPMKAYSEKIISEVKGNDTAVFIIKPSNYGVYKKVADALAKEMGVCQLYLMKLNKNDFLFLYDRFTSIVGSSKLSQANREFVLKSYNDDIDSILDLFQDMSEGKVFEKQSEIIAKCGVASNSIENYVLSLCKDLTGSEKGLKTVMRNKIKMGRELITSTSPQRLYFSMMKVVKAIITLKEQKIAGSLHRDIEDKNLARYQKYLWRISDVPLSKFVTIYLKLGKKPWEDMLDFLNFIYNLYDVKSKAALEKLSVVS